jgi:hypothetical protein
MDIRQLKYFVGIAVEFVSIQVTESLYTNEIR